MHVVVDKTQRDLAVRALSHKLPLSVAAAVIADIEADVVAEAVDEIEAAEVAEELARKKLEKMIDDSFTAHIIEAGAADATAQ